MIYIYNCYGGTHSSSIASEVHLKRLPADRLPTTDEILNASYFNKLSYKDMGRTIYRGTDDEGNRVYTIGRGTSKILVPCLIEMIRIFNSEYGFNEKIVFSNMSPTVPPAMTMGGFFSRGLGINFIGVPLLVVGAKQAYWHISRLVAETREKAKSFEGPVLMLDNKKK